MRVFDYLISFMIHTKMGLSDQWQDCGGRMAHYFYFISLVNQYLFHCIACIFTKLAKIKIWKNDKRSTFLGKFGVFQFPLLNWFCVKYNYPFKIAISINSISTMTVPIVYFCSLVMPEGKPVLCLPRPLI